MWHEAPPPDPTPAPPAGGPAPERSGAPAREWAEVLAVLVVAAAVALVGYGLLSAWAAHADYANAIGAPFDQWDLILPYAAQGGSIISALLVALGLGLVLVAPGPVGPWGRVALNAVSVVGVAVAALAALGIVSVVRTNGQATAVAQVAEALRWLSGLVLGGVAAWIAWRALNDDLGDDPPTAAPTDDVTTIDLPLDL